MSVEELIGWVLHVSKSACYNYFPVVNHQECRYSLSRDEINRHVNKMSGEELIGWVLHISKSACYSYFPVVNHQECR